MYRSVVIFLVFLFLSPPVFSQVSSGLSYETNCEEDIHGFPPFIDTINNILYMGGYYDTINNIQRRSITAIDLKTGNILPWNPIIPGGKVKAIVRVGNTVYVGGNFTSVNGQTRNNLAAINATTGVLLPWMPEPNNDVLSIVADNNYLYVGGLFTNIAGSARNYLSLFNLINGSLDSWSPPLISSDNYFDKVTVSGSKIYGVCSNTLSCNSLYEINRGSSSKTSKMEAGGGFISDYLLYNGNIYSVGRFTAIGGSPRKYAAAVSISTSILQSWQPTLTTTAIPATYHIECFKDTFFISSTDFGRKDTAYNYIKKFSPLATGSYLGLMKYYDVVNDHFSHDLIISSGKMAETSYKYCFGTNYYLNRVKVYCFKPNLPQPFTVSSAKVCQGQQGVVFTLPAQQGYAGCEWSYTGTGATIIGNSSSITINFSLTATTGVLKVKGVNICGLKSDEALFAVTVNPMPNADAGPDDTITCKTPALTLTGSGFSTSGPVNYRWASSSGTISSMNTANVSSKGVYTLTVTVSSTGCKNIDSVQVFLDTIHPALQSIPPYDTLNCYSSSALLNAITSNPLDSIRWLNSSGQGFLNPYAVTLEDNYVCVAMDRSNGCISKDTVAIVEDKVNPHLLILFTDIIITCKEDSALLFGNSFASPVKMNWVTVMGDTLPNPAYVRTPGWQTFIVTDLGNGCVSTKKIYVSADTIAPIIYPLSDSALLTCSFPSTTLNANVYPSFSSVEWNRGGAAQFSDPAVVNVAGKYIVTVVDTMNGCEAKDSVTVVYKPYLSVNAGNDTLICNNTSTILTAGVVNGTPGFTFDWNNGLGALQSIIVFPSDTTNYILSVTDAAGCYGNDTVTTFLAPPLKDSIVTFVPCDIQNIGALQVYTSGGISPYNYSINGGVSYQSSSLFDSLLLGSYQVVIRDTIGCIHTDSALISANSIQPEVNFLVSTNLYLGDTLVLVDISNPRPDTVIWNFPAGINVINNDPFSPMIIYTDTGSFSVNMQAVYGDCVLEKNKEVSIFSSDTSLATNYNNNGIKNISVSPNPNTGNFYANVELYKKQTFVVFVYDAVGVERYRKVVNDSDIYSENILINSAVPGTYTLMVIAEFDAGSKTFVVTQ